MSYYSFSITTPKNTPKTAKQKTGITLGSGVIHNVRVRIPPGSRGLLHCQVNHHLHQIAPTGEEDDFHGDDEDITYKEFYEIRGTDTVFDVLTWNESTKYEHEIILQLGVLPSWVLIPYAIAQTAKNAWDKMVGVWH
uniref:Uncharacterized protein n=1 Tax=viral metagenome TaxID=1070528 RepID=A0A6H1ZT46_9ZZZZ